MDLVALVEAFEGKRIAVIGDPLWDVYHFGQVDRLSPEAPVPVFREQKVEWRHGGAANVAKNLEALGCQPSTFFPVEAWEQKHRYMVGQHQLFRVDIEHRYIPKPIYVGECDAIVLSDYWKGWLSRDNCRQIIAEAKCPVIADPKVHMERFTGCTAICPNEKEAYGRVWQGVAKHVVIKRGEKGMDVDGINIPAQAKHVYDVTGAGDTVTAVIAAGLACGADIYTAALLASYAAGYVVGEIGTTSCSAEKLLELIGQ